MAHAIDNATGKNAIAYVGEKPWHGLGQELTYDASIDTWKKEAGLDFTVERARVGFIDKTGMAHSMTSREVLYRDDTKSPLGIVSNGYKVVQPGEVLEFFRDLTEQGGFTMDTAGVLHGGKRVWALAKMSEGDNVIGSDRVMPYLLLATSFDGGLATTAKFTGIRVVCHNTISIALNREEQCERAVKVAHHSAFDATQVKKQMGLVRSAWDQFMANSRLMAGRELDAKLVDRMTLKLVEPTLGKKADGSKQDDEGVRDSKSYRAIMELFNGNAIGADLTGGPTTWAWLNAVTQYVDHERGRNPDTRMNSAWFGNGDTLKTRALGLAAETI
jgi:phage/plasmid-like protein (TIGR03299 family)